MKLNMTLVACIVLAFAIGFGAAYAKDSLRV
jgi:hypothetical protein